MTDSARDSGSGCLLWLGVLGGLAALTSAVLWFTVLRGSDDQTATAGPTGSVPTTASPTGTETAPGCSDATQEFLSSATGPGVEYVRSVCWESGGQLRADIDLAGDVNIDAAPMVGLCTALTEFVTASGRPWQGFTAYSSSPLTPGRGLLTRAQPDQPCQKPAGP